MTELYYHLHSEDKATPLLPTTKEDVLKVLLLYPTVDSVQAHVWVEGLATTDPLFAIAPALATTELTAAYWLAQKQAALDQRQDWDPDLLKNLASQVQQLKGLGTWTSESETMVGRSVLSESILDPLLLQDIVPPLPSQPLLDIVSKQFEALQLNKASSEAKVQALFSSLFNELILEVSKVSKGHQYPCFQVHDTSNKGFLKNPIAKVDLTFTSGAQVAWSDVVWLAQVKTSLNSKEDYEEALGQVSDRAQTLFNMQPERKWVIAALLGSSSMEVLRLPRYSDQDRIKRTGLMPLTGVSSPQGLTGAPAARSLLQLIVATEEDFGFKHPFLPQPFSLKSGSDHLDLYEFECLRISKDADSVSAYKAMVKSRSSPQVPVKPVVVKFGKEATINKEVSVLKLLSTHNIQFTPRLICHGKSPDLRSCLVIEPVGHLIGSGDFPPAVIGQVALDIATTIIDLSKVGILHCDVSAGNVLVTDEGRGLLVDYGSSLEGAHVGSHRVTGTLLFSAFSVLWGENNTVSSDLESLFYAILHIVCDGEVPGCREASSSRVAAYRMAAMLHPKEFERHVLKKVPPIFCPLVQGLRNLFFNDLPAPASGHLYVTNVDPQSFLDVCRDFRDSFLPPPSSPLLPPSPSPSPLSQRRLGWNSAAKRGSPKPRIITPWPHQAKGVASVKPNRIAPLRASSVKLRVGGPALTLLKNSSSVRIGERLTGRLFV